MIVYLDSSALVKLVLDEEGSDPLRRELEGFERLASSALAYVELRAALAAAVRDRRLSVGRHDDVLALAERVWVSVSERAVDTALLRSAGDLAASQRLRAYDAVHLATLRTIADPSDVVFACWDNDLRAAARHLGYRLLPSRAN